MTQHRRRLQVTTHDVDWAGVSYESLDQQYGAPALLDRSGNRFAGDMAMDLEWDSGSAPAYAAMLEADSYRYDISQSIVILEHDPVSHLVSIELILEDDEDLTEVPDMQCGFVTVMPIEDARRIIRRATADADWWVLKRIPDTQYALMAYGHCD